MASALAVISMTAVASAAGFSKSQEYQAGKFSDVPEGADMTCWTRYGVTLSDGTKKDPNFWKSSQYILENGKWFEYPSSIAISAGDQVINNWSFRKSKQDEYYLDNIRVYFKQS